ncbi:MAG: hypothetical protein NTX61_00600 [Bacteroidetes bacterium]|nr:hypothetical protein [Bacteroidota bacterium]
MKKISELFLLTIICELLFPVSGLSQGEWNNWTFGSHAGVNFNSGIPLPITTVNYFLMAPYSSATTSDSTGNLLFYASAFTSPTVYNRNNDPMPNGLLFSNNDANAFQPYFVVQNLTDDSTYFLFVVRSPSVSYGGLFYSLINMRLDGGLGDIEPTEKMVPVPGGEWTAYVITGTRHQNNKDVWIVTRNRHNSYKYLSYLITASGIDTVPVQSQSTYFISTTYSNQGIDFIRISPDGTKLICLYDSVAEY